jgi:hypothetical protein
MAEHDGCTRTCFEKEAGAEKMSEEIFLRHSLQDREWKSGKNFSEADNLFCVFNLLGAQKTFHRQSVWIQIGVDGILMGSHELIGDGSGNCQPREKLC